MLRHGRLLHGKAGDDVAYRPFGECEVIQDLAPPGLGHRIERIRSCFSSGHDQEYTFLYGNMSRIKFPREESLVFNGGSRNGQRRQKSKAPPCPCKKRRDKGGAPDSLRGRTNASVPTWFFFTGV